MKDNILATHNNQLLSKRQQDRLASNGKGLLAIINDAKSDSTPPTDSELRIRLTSKDLANIFNDQIMQREKDLKKLGFIQ